MQGASATGRLLTEFTAKPVRPLIVWEPVLPTDFGPPSTASLRRIADPRTIQFWDSRRLISHVLGEHDDDTIVWDYVAVYSVNTLWNQRPKPLFEAGPVVRVVAPLRQAVVHGLAGG